MASERILELLRRPSSSEEHDEIRELWKTHSKAEDNRDIAGSALDADRGLRLHRRGHRRAVGGSRGRDALLHRAPDGVPRHPLRARLHRHRASGRLRGGDGDGDPRGTLARARADRREARLAERHLLPLGSGGASLQGRDGLHRSRVPDVRRARTGPGTGPEGACPPWIAPHTSLTGSVRCGDRPRADHEICARTHTVAPVDLDLVFLGTAGSAPTAARGTSATLIRRGGDRLLVDCGEGTQRQLLRSDAGLADLEDVFLTHHHADHVLGLPGMLKTFSLRGRETTITVHGPRGTRSLLSALRIVIGRLTYPLDVRELEPDEAVERDGYRIVPFAGLARARRDRIRASRGRASRAVRSRRSGCARRPRRT